MYPFASEHTRPSAFRESAGRAAPTRSSDSPHRARLAGSLGRGLTALLLLGPQFGWAAEPVSPAPPAQPLGAFISTSPPAPPHTAATPKPAAAEPAKLVAEPAKSAPEQAQSAPEQVKSASKSLTFAGDSARSTEPSDPLAKRGRSPDAKTSSTAQETTPAGAAGLRQFVTLRNSQRTAAPAPPSSKWRAVKRRRREPNRGEEPSRSEGPQRAAGGAPVRPGSREPALLSAMIDTRTPRPLPVSLPAPPDEHIAAEAKVDTLPATRPDTAPHLAETLPAEIASSTTSSRRRPASGPEVHREATAGDAPRPIASRHPVAGYATAGSQRTREQAALMRELWERPATDRFPTAVKDVSESGRDEAFVAFGDGEPSLLVQIVNAAIASHRVPRPRPEIAAAKSHVTLRRDWSTRRRPRRDAPGRALKFRDISPVDHQEPNEAEPSPPSLRVAQTVPPEPVPPTRRIAPPSIIPPPGDRAAPSMENELLAPPAAEPEAVEPGEAAPEEPAPEEVAPGRRQLTEEDRRLWEKIEKYGRLRSIGKISLNIQPFSHREPGDDDSDRHQLHGEIPGNAAALLLRDQEVVRYVSGPPRPSIDYAGLLSLADFCHRPLYFEQVNVERYGTHRPVIQPALSAIQFFAGVPALPYKMTIQRPNVCYYYDHPFQAGRPAPWERQLPPLHTPAGLVEAGVIMGLIFLIP